MPIRESMPWRSSSLRMPVSVIGFGRAGALARERIGLSATSTRSAARRMSCSCSAEVSGEMWSDLTRVRIHMPTRSHRQSSAALAPGRRLHERTSGSSAV